MEQYKIDRINALARKAKVQELTPQELAEREELRREYIAAVKRNLIGQLGELAAAQQNDDGED